ncbi:MAG: hypothetical protein JNL69_09700 [Bacteroidia bacterium]|nr:hypothetical protein [Bacteroidia bacterium]
MKKIIFVLFFSLSLITISIAQEVVSEVKLIDSTPEDFELSDAQYTAWKKISNNWLSDDFEKIKFEHKIELNCQTCSSVYLDVIIKINANGKLEYYKLIKGKKCGMELTKPLELRMMRSFFKYEYPPELRNVIFKTHLGTTLKC